MPKITEYAAIAALDDDDIMVIVEDGTNKKVTVAELRAALGGAEWTEQSSTWTYASATTFTVTGDVTGQFRKGSRIRLKQGGSYKYFYVTAAVHSAGTTTVTVFAGYDYSLANAGITDKARSQFPLPEGFPEVFNHTPVWTTDTGSVAIGNGTLTGTVQVDGNRCMYVINWASGSTTTYGSGGWSFPVPIAAAGGNAPGKGAATAIDGGSTRHHGIAWTEGANLRIAATGDWSTWWDNNYPFTWNNGDTFSAELDYRI